MRTTGRMARIARSLLSALLIVTLVVTLCAGRPQPVLADTDTATIGIILGVVILGLILISVLLTLLVRNNPAWMPALPDGNPLPGVDAWGPPDDRLRFGWDCRGPDGAMALLCW